MAEAIQAWFQGGPTSQSHPDSTSLLDSWKSYEAQSQGLDSRDVEAGGFGSMGGLPDPLGLGLNAGIDSFFRSASEGVSGAITSVSKNVQDLPGSIQKQATALPSRQALTYFVVMNLTGAFFMSLAFTMFLPALVLAPQKFAICFTIGCILVIGSFFALKGPSAQLQSMTSSDRLPFTLFLIGSMASTLYVSMVMHSYILSVVSSGAQVLALVYYIISFFPGGATGLRWLTSMATSTFRSLIG